MKRNTNKYKTIEAIEEIIVWLESASFQDRPFGNQKRCLLCKIHYRKDANRTCIGCPLADSLGEMGCTNLSKIILRHSTCNMEYNDIPKLKLLVNELKKYPESQFTKKGWEYFPLLETYEDAPE